MAALYVVSQETGAGKTVICAGIGKYLQSMGKKVGFLKPITGGSQDGDAAFMKQVLSLSEALESLCPQASDVKKVKDAYDKVSPENDVVIVEGASAQNPDNIHDVAKALNAKVIVVETYSKLKSMPVTSYKGFENSLLGVVLNKVPASQLQRARDEASAQLGEAGITLLGVLPEDRALFAITVGELADCIQGKILNNAEKATDLVESLMLGAMIVDSGPGYFGRKNNKAAVIRGDRPDMQMAALETSTRCLVLSGSTAAPIYSVTQKAESRGIPIIQSENDTSAIVTSIEDALGSSRLNQTKKLSKLAELIQPNVNLQAVL